MENLSQKRRAEMLEYLNHLKEIHTDDESRIALEKIETALTEKKYGLVWEEHEEEVDKKLVHNIPVFREIEDKKIVWDNTKDFNFLLEGDNLHSLKLLEKTHKGKVDVIYIDPPYNTGNKDFIYDDNYIGSDDGYKHSKWLSFMNERLRIARKLLKNDGVIFISIDDREQAQLKLLCDSIFGEENKIGNISVVNNLKGRSDDKFFATANEFLFVYCKDREKPIINGFPLDEDKKAEYKLSDDISKYKLVGLKKTGKGCYKEDRPNMYYPIYYSPLNNVISLTNEYSDSIEILPQINGRDGRWRWGKDTFNEKSLTELVCQKNSKGEYVIYVKMRNIVNGEKRTIKPKTIWINPQYDSGNGTKMTKDIFGDKVFTNPKPLQYIKDIIYISTAHKNDAIILDYFAGSGTTGHAVMQLNKEDGGNRKYILCTNNENNICEEITYQRMKNIQKELPHNLKYYKTEFIPKLSEDEEILSSKLLDYIKEMVELENMCEIDGNSRRIILSDEDLKMALSEMKEGGVLYIPSFILLTNEIKDSIEERKLEVVTIPDYYFTEELREVSEL